MELKVLFQDKYKVLAVTDRGECPVEEQLINGDADTEAWRDRLQGMLSDISELGLHGAPSVWLRRVNSEHGIFELKSGDLRVFYFKGHDDIILICTSVARKKTKKVDPAEVARAIRFKQDYEEAIQRNALRITGEV